MSSAVFTSGKRRPWLADSRVPYPEHKEYFCDPSHYPAIAEVEANWTIIRDELMSALNAGDTDFKPYKDLEKMDKTTGWQTMGLMYWTRKSRRHIGRFPETWKIFRNIPNLTSCSLHLLEPHSMIKPHIGDTDAMVRCHIGLIVPAGLPQCGFRCGSGKRAWVEGKALCFNDAREHCAWNNTDRQRYIISFDLMHPEFLPIKHWIGAQVMGRINVEVMYQRNPWMKRYFGREWQMRLLLRMWKLVWFLRLKLDAAINGSL